MDKKYCIFDLDGTLIDSMDYWTETPRNLLISLGVKEGIDDALKMSMPMSVEESSGYFIDRFNLDITREELMDRVSKMMADHYKNDIPLKKGVESYLKRLKEVGAKICIGSATDEELIYECIERLGIRDYFDFALSCDTIGVSKHKPDIYIEAAKKIGARIEDTAVFEDLLLTVTTAKKAGFYTVAKFDENQKDDWDQIEKLADESIYDFEDAVKNIR